MIFTFTSNNICNIKLSSKGLNEFDLTYWDLIKLLDMIEEILKNNLTELRE